MPAWGDWPVYAFAALSLACFAAIFIISIALIVEGKTPGVNSQGGRRNSRASRHAEQSHIAHDKEAFR